MFRILRQNGFSLIGLLVTVAIVGVLLAMSLQNYQPVLQNFQTGTPGQASFKLDISREQLRQLQRAELMYFNVHNSYATWEQLVSDGEIARGYNKNAIQHPGTPFIPYYDINIEITETGFVITATPSIPAGAPPGTATLKIDQDGNLEEVPTR
jgi:prepilin-type N-terminal cleavage/methylation domain-containing protein